MLDATLHIICETRPWMRCRKQNSNVQVGFTPGSSDFIDYIFKGDSKFPFIWAQKLGNGNFEKDENQRIWRIFLIYLSIPILFYLESLYSCFQNLGKGSKLFFFTEFLFPIYILRISEHISRLLMFWEYRDRLYILSSERKIREILVNLLYLKLCTENLEAYVSGGLNLMELEFGIRDMISSSGS